MMRTGAASSFLAVVSAVAVSGCGTRPSSPTDNGSTIGSTTYRIDAPSDAGGVRAADAPGFVGDFRVKPAPGADGVIRISPAQSLVVNGNTYRQSNPSATLYLVVNWGDDTGNRRNGCGPCYLTHVYDTPGRYRLEMTMDDGIVPQVGAAPPVTEAVTVIVEGLPTLPSGTPLSANAPVALLNTGVLTCPTFTVTTLLMDADGDAISWAATLSTGTLNNPAAGGPVPSGTIVTITGTLTLNVPNVIRFDLVDASGRPSVPIVRLAPVPVCAPGTTLSILG